MRRLPLALPLLLAACSQDYDIKATAPDVDPGDITECGFSRVEETDFYRYDCNPVFTSSTEAWAQGGLGGTAFHVTEVVGHPFYQMWYVGSEEGEDNYTGLGYAASDNGTEWIPHDENPLLGRSEAGAWDYDVMEAPVVVWDPDSEEYILAYHGMNLTSATTFSGMGVATSPDGVRWERSPANPVFNLDEGTGQITSLCWPLGVGLAPEGGLTGYIAGIRNNQDTCEMFGVDASDPERWTLNDRIVLAAGVPGAWDDTGMISAAQATLNDQRLLFYVGFGSWTTSGRVRYATNSFFGVAEWDGDRWVKWADNPIPLQMTGDGQVSSIAANTVGDRVHIWINDLYEVDGVSTYGVGYFLYEPGRED